MKGLKFFIYINLLVVYILAAIGVVEFIRHFFFPGVEGIYNVETNGWIGVFGMALFVWFFKCQNLVYKIEEHLEVKE